jgi:hypothetical protein
MTKSVSTSSFISIGIDIGIEVFHIVGFDSDGKLPRTRRRMKVIRGALYI